MMIRDAKRRYCSCFSFTALLMTCVAVAGILSSCWENEKAKPPVTKPTGRVAHAVLNPTKDNNVKGTVEFIDLEEGVKIIANIEGLAPGKHGFHIHEFGDCSAPDALSAGGHFNPRSTLHGGPMDLPRHVGDLGNIEPDKHGKAHYQRLDYVLQLKGAESIIGKSVIVHTNKDDFISQPTGNAGPRVACGVIVEGPLKHR